MVDNPQYELYHGDCLEIMPTLPDSSVDAIIADLPYGTTACAWDSVIPLEPLWEQYKRLIKPRGIIALFGDEPFTSVLICSALDWFNYRLTWRKSRPTGFLDANRKPLDDSEDIVIFCRGQSTYNPQMKKGQPNHVSGKIAITKRTSIYSDYRHTAGIKTENKYPRRIIEFQSLDPAQKTLHPNEKPLPLLEYLVLTYTNPGDVVLDNTFGSCTTGEACLRTGRRFVGIEMDSEYFRIGQERMADVARELRGEWKQLNGNNTRLDDLPLFVLESEAVEG